MVQIRSDRRLVKLSKGLACRAMLQEKMYPKLQDSRWTKFFGLAKKQIKGGGYRVCLSYFSHRSLSGAQ